MATKKTNAQLTAELEKANAELKKFSGLEKKINDAINNCIETYSLDLCDEGLRDFMQQIGFTYEAPEAEVVLNISIGSVKVPQISGGYYGADFDTDALVTEIEQVLTPVLAKYKASDTFKPYVEVNDVEAI